MSVTPQLRLTGLVAAVALAAASASIVVTPPATAAPVFVDASTRVVPSAGVEVNNGSCTRTQTPVLSPTTPVVENGAPTTVTSSVTGTGTDGADDTATMSAQATATASVRSAGGDPTTVDLSVTGQAQLTTALAQSACEYYVYAGHELGFRFSVAHAGFVHISSSAPAGAYTGIYLYNESDPSHPSVTFYAAGPKLNDTHTYYLAAGSYEGQFQGSIYPELSTSRTVSGTVSIHAEFTVAGSQTEPATGKGSRYVSLPTARSCAAGTLTTSVTTAKRSAKKIKVVKLWVNGRLVTKVKKPKKGAATALGVAADQAADVTAEVTLFPKKKHGKAKVYEVSASYEACS